MIISEKFAEKNSKGTKHYYVFRRCDQCGEERKARLDSLKANRKRRGKDIDFCWICGNKNRILPKGDKHQSFKHGLQNGYRRITVNGKRCYEHKFIVENHIGRKVLRSEEIHHIDCDKLNNLLPNLYLCSKKYHAKIHKQIEELGFSFFNTHIWFSEKLKKYVLYKTNNIIRESIDTTVYASKNDKKIKTSKYICRKKDGKSIALHTLIMEDVLGRKFFRDECVHHVSGDTHDNDINNLILMNWTEHRACHRSLQLCVGELYKQGIIGFDKDVGQYFIV